MTNGDGRTDDRIMNDDTRPAPGHRAVRSYVRRAGRITTAQRRALDELWPRYGLAHRPEPLDLDHVFGRRAGRVLEIGFGDGEQLVAMAAADPARDYLGIEVHEPGIGHCLLALERLDLANVRLICHDAVDVLRTQLPDASLEAVHLLFPDPWPKKRHHKRRLVQAPFAKLVAAKLHAGGVFHVATDWAPYAEHIEAVLAAEPSFEIAPANELPPRERTKFERRGARLGHGVFEQAWRRCTTPRC